MSTDTEWAFPLTLSLTDPDHHGVAVQVILDALATAAETLRAEGLTGSLSLGEDATTEPLLYLPLFEDPTTTCRWCHRGILQDSEGRWVCPEAGFDVEGGDGIWRETCEDHPTFIADHEPTEETS